MPKLPQILFALLGLTATTLALIGVWLPGVPTTIFLLVAIWAFSRSSPRLTRLLRRIPLLKNALAETERFQRDGTVTIRAKYLSQACSWTSCIVLTIMLQNFTITLVTGLLALACTGFMLSVPTAEKNSQADKPRAE